MADARHGSYLAPSRLLIVLCGQRVRVIGVFDTQYYKTMPTLNPRPQDYPSFSSRAPIEVLEDGTDFSSSNVHSLLYDFGAFAPEGVDEEARQMLIARYKRDGADAVYEYEGFPANEWAGLAAASSKGRYINLNVKGVYGFTRLRLSRWPGGTRSVAHPVARRFLDQGITVDPEASHPHQ